MAFTPIDPTQTDKDSPVNVSLMDLVRTNFDDHEARIQSLESTSGGGGGSADSGAYGAVTSGGETNEGKYWKRRFHPFENKLSQDKDGAAVFDPEGKLLKNELLTFLESNDSGISRGGADIYTYLGAWMRINKDSSISFKIKKGINFFALTFSTFSTSTDNITVTIDGNTPTSFGLVDENGAAAPDNFTTVTASQYYQVPFFYYGLDGEEHVVTITNNDSGSNFAVFDSVEVGYRSEDFTISEEILIKEGKAAVRGSEVSFDESVLSFGKTDKNGHTGSIVCDSGGALSVIDGESPAMTQVKAQEAVAFSGSVTTLPCKNTWYFPSNGICLLSTPWGGHHLFSYNAKSESTIQTHSLDGIIWQSKPNTDITPLSDFDSAGDAIGDLNINYWGTAPIVITSGNNKIDFEITIDGVTTTHVATIPVGNYAADIVPLSKVAREAMRSAKSFRGDYEFFYNPESRLWSIGVTGEADSINLLFNSGVNQANSIHPTLGYPDTDLNSKKSHISTNEVQHLSAKVFLESNDYIDASGPNVKRSATGTGDLYTSASDLEDRLGSGKIFINSGATLIQIYPDDDCCGIRLDFPMIQDGAMLTAQIDEGQFIYLCQNDWGVSSPERGKMISGFLSFPKGSRKISVRVESQNPFEIIDSVQRMAFAGAKQYYSKPAWEKLTSDQAIIKEFEIAPISLYRTDYSGISGALYSPAVSDDQINTITESGSWLADTSVFVFNRSGRYTATDGDYVDIDFTVVDSGGGVALKYYIDSGRPTGMEFYLSASAINESTDLIQVNNQVWSTAYYDQSAFTYLGLPSGTYILRVKKPAGSGGNMYYNAIGIIDGTHPQANANTLTDINNTGQGLAYPINVKRVLCANDDMQKVPSYLERRGYKEGKVGLVNSNWISPGHTNYDDNASLITRSDLWYGNESGDNGVGVSNTLSAICKSVTSWVGAFSTRDPSSQCFIDGVQTLNTSSQGVQVKGGTSPTGTRASASPLFQKEFDLACSFSAGDTFTMSDTRGIKNDLKVRLYDGTNYEDVYVVSFVVGTSITLTSRSVVVDANVISVSFAGFHTFKTVSGTASDYFVNHFEYEPLTISPSIYRKRLASTFKYEKVSRKFEAVANGGDMYYPVHSDGVYGSWKTSTIEIIGQSGTVSAYSFPEDLKGISITGGGTLDVRITTERNVPVLDDEELF